MRREGGALLAGGAAAMRKNCPSCKEYALAATLMRRRTVRRFSSA